MRYGIHSTRCAVCEPRDTMRGTRCAVQVIYWRSAHTKNKKSAWRRGFVRLTPKCQVAQSSRIYTHVNMRIDVDAVLCWAGAAHWWEGSRRGGRLVRFDYCPHPPVRMVSAMADIEPSGKKNQARRRAWRRGSCGSRACSGATLLGAPVLQVVNEKQIRNFTLAITMYAITS